MRLPIVALLLGLAFLAGLRTQAILAPAQAAAAASPQVYHIAPTDTYPKLAQGIWGEKSSVIPLPATSRSSTHQGTQPLTH